MFILIERYINNLTIHDLNNLAISNNILLSNEELSFAFEFIKKNWQTILANHGVFDIDRYKDRFSEENFYKIKKLIKDSLLKYGHLI